MRALKGFLLILVFASGLAWADEVISPRNGQGWGAGSAQDLLNMTHDPMVVSKDAGKDPEQAQVANICRTQTGDYFREGEQGYDACLTELRKKNAALKPVKPVSN